MTTLTPRRTNNISMYDKEYKFVVDVIAHVCPWHDLFTKRIMCVDTFSKI